MAALAFLAVVGWIVVRRTGSIPAGAAVAGVGLVCGALAFTVPQALRPLWVVLMVVNYPIGWVVTHVVMALIFYLVVTPVGVIMRLSGRDPIERGFDRTAKTYWKPRRTEHDPARYFRQY